MEYKNLLKTMKRILFIFAIAAVFTACNKPAQTEAVQQDTVVVETPVVADTLAVDSVAVVDSAVVAQ